MRLHWKVQLTLKSIFFIFLFYLNINLTRALLSSTRWKTVSSLKSIKVLSTFWDKRLSHYYPRLRSLYLLLPVGRGQAEDWLLDIGLAPAGLWRDSRQPPGCPSLYSVDYPSWIWDKHDHTSKIFIQSHPSFIPSPIIFLFFLWYTFLLLHPQLQEAKIKKGFPKILDNCNFDFI